MTEPDINAMILPGLLWDLGAHVVMGGVIGLIPQRPRTAYILILIICLAEALLVAAAATLFGGAFIAMAAPEHEPLWSSTGAIILALFAGLFLVSFVTQGLPTLFGAWLSRRIFRRSVQ
jgi:RsiW-degrading membrane proteinase PrsW (M82 family)